MAQDNIGSIIQDYIQKRDELAAWKKQVDEEERLRKLALNQIEIGILKLSDELGVDSFKTEFGTAYRTTEEHFRVQDWTAFVAYVKETDNFSLFQKRVTKTVAKEIYEDTGVLPAGLDYFAEYKINVRRPTGGSKKEKGGGDSNGE